MLRTVGSLRNCHWTELRHDVERGWHLRAHNVGPMDVPAPGTGTGAAAVPVSAEPV